MGKEKSLNSIIEEINIRELRNRQFVRDNTWKADSIFKSLAQYRAKKSGPLSGKKFIEAVNLISCGTPDISGLNLIKLSGAHLGV